MRKKKLTRREREKSRHRSEILVAALNLFSEKGYHNVSVHDIAKEAEFAIGTLYGFFKNKESLYKDLVLEHSDKFHAALTIALDEGDDELAKILNYARRKGEIFMDNAKVVRLYMAETRGAGFNIKAGLDADIRQPYEEILTKLASVFRSGIRKKIFQKLDPYYLALALDSLTNTVLFLWLEDPKRHPYQRKVKTMINILLDQVRIG